MSRIDLLVIVVAIVAGALWIEQRHHVVIEAPAPAQVASPPPAACPDNDNVPYSAGCLRFLSGGHLSGAGWQANAAERAAARASR